MNEISKQDLLEYLEEIRIKFLAAMSGNHKFLNNEGVDELFKKLIERISDW